ncbi:hypothetical protein LEMA_P102100.1 [Plenodomus lingam JN3]|uniref:Small ribosomal subunit protein mS29 n=1 Tax=Leptosphaeria maculans (strain JN3 / isolate v23.1.3 / race Av1-4-5-6-7-8) TaxID=985895 RepID=E5A0L9_LEPMJ|nr:hypothetical protein LEMA_P102100.1 [Plenodomus lingam JN3]CBX97079.1 hypothetical protein LEMA_P102100.1 [Plenodomus lingam JN3]
MPPPTCLQSFARLSLDASTTHAPRLVRPQVAFFSTSAVRHAVVMKKKQQSAAPKKGVKTLRVGKKKTAADTGKRPAQGERKALRKRIVLSNNNALEVTSLKDLNKENVLSEENEGRVMGLPAEQAVDKLRTVDAFRPSQGWSLFRRPAVLIRKEAIQIARLFKEVEASSTDARKKTIRRILSGERMSGKSTLLLQSLAMGFLRDWFVISLPEAQDIVNAHTAYAPLEKSEPMQYTQDDYTSALLQKMLDSNSKFLESTKLSTQPNLPLPLAANASLKDLVIIGVNAPEASWPVFVALWNELSQTGRPPVLLTLDGLSHIMRNSEYMSAEVKPIHAHDLTLIRHFVDHLSGAKPLPNGGIPSTSASKSRKLDSRRPTTSHNGTLTRKLTRA